MVGRRTGIWIWQVKAWDDHTLTRNGKKTNNIELPLKNHHVHFVYQIPIHDFSTFGVTFPSKVDWFYSIFYVKQTFYISYLELHVPYMHYCCAWSIQSVKLAVHSSSYWILGTHIQHTHPASPVLSDKLLLTRSQSHKNEKSYCTSKCVMYVQYEMNAENTHYKIQYRKPLGLSHQQY